MGLVCDLMEDCDMLPQTIATAKTMTEHGSVALQLAKEAVCRGKDQRASWLPFTAGYIFLRRKSPG